MRTPRCPDLTPREWASVVPLCAMAIVMGVFPTLFLAPMDRPSSGSSHKCKSVQPLRVHNEMQNAGFKMQTATNSQQPDEVRQAVNPVVP